MGCKGLHCDGCHHGSPAGPAAAVLALLVIVAVAAREVWPKVVHTVEIAAWTVAGVTGAAIVITGTVLTVRAVRRARARRAARQVTYRITPAVPAPRRTGPPAIDRPARPALGQPPRRQAGTWPLPGWWQDIRPHIGGDGDEHPPR
jgi:hypothetical protein